MNGTDERNDPQTTIAALWKWCRAHPLAAAGIAATLLAGLVALLVLPSGGRTPDGRDTASPAAISTPSVAPVPVPAPSVIATPPPPPEQNSSYADEPWLGTLTGFATDFGTVTATSEQWRAAVTRWTAPAATAGFMRTDVRTVTADTDPQFDVLNSSDTHADVAVRYRAGLAIVVRVRNDPGWGGWKVTEVQPDNR